MEHTKFLIIGAGVTGLAFADHLLSDDYQIIEGAPSIGGYCKTVKQDGFVWDYSGHFFHFRHPELESHLRSRMDADSIATVQKSSKIYWNGCWIDFPFQNNIHQLPREDFIDCIHDLILREPLGDANFHDMLYSRFGAAICDRFLIPYNEKLYATDLRLLEAGAMGRFFPDGDATSIVRGFKSQSSSSYNSTFIYPAGGAIEFVNALARHVPSERIHTSEEVQQIDLTARVATTSKRRIRYEHVISSAPLPALLSLCSLPFEPEHFSWNKVAVFNLGFDRKGPPGIHWAYFPQRDIAFYRVGFYDNIRGDSRMSLYVEVGLQHDADVAAPRMRDLKDQVLDHLGRVGIVDDQRLVSSHQVVMDPAYVHVTSAALEDIQRFRAVLGSNDVYSIGRYGGWTYCSIEDNMIESRYLAETFNAVSGL